MAQDPTILPDIRDGRGHMSYRTKMTNFYDRMFGLWRDIGKNIDLPPPPLEPQLLNIDEDKLYANMPPIEIEAFMDVPSEDTQAHNIEYFAKKDILVARVKCLQNNSSQGDSTKLDLEPIAFEGGKKRYLIGRSNEIEVVCDVHNFPDSHRIESYEQKVYVRVVIIQVTKDQPTNKTTKVKARLETSMLSEHLPLHMVGKIKLGKLSVRELPKYMQKKAVKDKTIYSRMLRSTSGFNNPLSTEYLVQRLGIREPSRYSLLGTLSTIETRPELTSVILRINQQKEWSQPHIEKAISHYKSGQSHLALLSFETALRLNPNSVRALVERASCFRMLKQFDKAVDDLAKAFKLEKSDDNKRLLADCFFEYGQLLFDEKRWSHSKSFFDKAIQYDPDHPSAKLFSRLACDKEKDNNNKN